MGANNLMQFINALYKRALIEGKSQEEAFYDLKSIIISSEGQAYRFLKLIGKLTDDDAISAMHHAEAELVKIALAQ